MKHYIYIYMLLFIYNNFTQYSFGMIGFLYWCRRTMITKLCFRCELTHNQLRSLRASPRFLRAERYSHKWTLYFRNDRIPCVFHSSFLLLPVARNFISLEIRDNVTRTFNENRGEKNTEERLREERRKWRTCRYIVCNCTLTLHPSLDFENRWKERFCFLICENLIEIDYMRCQRGT